MHEKIIRLIGAGMALLASHCTVAQPLSPDPAWKQGTLANGLHWQILATPQRPGDRTEIRFIINTGSLTETSQQKGYSHFLPRLALTQSGALTVEQARHLWRQSSDSQHPMPPVITSYSFTLFNISLPNNSLPNTSLPNTSQLNSLSSTANAKNNDDNVKNALTWLAGLANGLVITPQTIQRALHTNDMAASWPLNPQDGWWRYRLQGSNLIQHDPTSPLQQPPDAEALIHYYQNWYTPDSMTLIVVGNIESRMLSEYIIKTFSALPGKRKTPAPLPVLQPLPATPVAITTDRVSQNSVALIWDTPWQPIHDSASLLNYWQADLAREALFHVLQQKLQNTTSGKAANVPSGFGLQFDCRVLFGHGQCAMTLSAPENKLQNGLEQLAHALADIRDNGLQDDIYQRLISQKRDELKTLFATYAHTDTRTLINQRLRALQDKVVDIAPEQYQQLRQQFLDSITSEQLNYSLHQQLYQHIALALFQPANVTDKNNKNELTDPAQQHQLAELAQFTAGEESQTVPQSPQQQSPQQQAPQQQAPQQQAEPQQPEPQQAEAQVLQQSVEQQSEQQQPLQQKLQQLQTLWDSIMPVASHDTHNSVVETATPAIAAPTPTPDNSSDSPAPDNSTLDSPAPAKNLPTVPEHPPATAESVAEKATPVTVTPAPAGALPGGE